MNWKRESLRNFKLYAITDLKAEDPSLLDRLTQALKGGVDIVQLRSKTMSDASLMAIGQKIRRVTRALEKLFIVNDRVDLTLALDADGVHLGQDDLPIGVARKMMGKGTKIIGRSTHSLQQAEQAVREGADYIGFGPLFSTPTKPTYEPVGLEPIREVLMKSEIPVVCIGGIERSNVKQVVAAGANRIAVVRAVFHASDPFRAASELKGWLN